MKTKILLMFSLLCINGLLLAQTNKFKFIDSPIDHRIEQEIFQNRPQKDTLRFIPDKRSFPYRFEIKKDTVKKDYRQNIYPGSKRYYAKWPVQDQFDKFFIHKPDTSVKGFLIIKDPLE